MNSRKLIDIVSISIVSSFVFLGVYIVSPMLHQYAEVFNIPVSLTGWAISSYAIGRVMADLPAGIFSDKYGRKKAMILGLATITFSSIIAGSAPNYLVLLVARAIGGLGSALYITGAISRLSEISQGGERGKILSMYSSMVFIGMAIGPAITGYIAANYGIQAPFYAYTLLTSVGILVTIPLNETSQNSMQKSTLRWGDLKEVFSNRSFILVNFSVLALFFLRSSVRSTLLPLYASINLGLSGAQIGVLITISMITTGVLTFPAGLLSDRVGRRIPIMASTFSCALLSLFIPFQVSMESLIILVFAYGFATGLQGAISAWPADVAPSDKMGTAMGAYRFLGDLGFFLGPITVTYLSDYFRPDVITFESFLIPVLIVTIAGILLLKAEDPAGKFKFQR